MAEQLIATPKTWGSSIKVPLYRADINQMYLYRSIVKQLDTFAEKVHREWENAELERVTRLGAIEGLSQDVEYKKGSAGASGGDRLSKAFNKAAVEMQTKKVESISFLHLQELKNEFIADASKDPKGYKEKSEDYIKGIVQELQKTPQTAVFAGLLEQKLKLKQQADLFVISKGYREQQIAAVGASTDEFIKDLKTTTIQDAAGVFSGVDEIRANALNSLDLGLKMLDIQLNTLLPGDGMPLYSGEEKVQVRNQFEEDFFISIVQEYIETQNLTPEQMLTIESGALSIDRGDGSEPINILQQVGHDVYSKEVRRYLTKYLKAKNDIQAYVARAQEKQIEKDRQALGFQFLNSIKTGGGIATSLKEIEELQAKGLLTRKDAEQALNLLMDPDIGTDAVAILTQVNRMIAKGEDASMYIMTNITHFTKEKYLELMKANDMAQSRGLEALFRDYEQNFRREFVQRDMFGFWDTASERDYNDIVSVFRENIEAGMESETAYERMRVSGELAKDSSIFYKDVSKYLRLNEETKEVDYQASIVSIFKDVDEKVISKEDGIIYVDILEKQEAESQQERLKEGRSRLTKIYKETRKQQKK